MTFDESIKARRSIRRYKDTPVSPQDLTAVLEAGRLAPSASNAQNWMFTAVRSPKTRAQLTNACGNQDMLNQAPVSLVIWAKEDHEMPCGQSTASVDCSIALSFMMLKATTLGLGTCWLGAFDAPAVKELLRLPAKAVVVAVTPLGTADETPNPRPRKQLDEVTEVRD